MSNLIKTIFGCVSQSSTLQSELVDKLLNEIKKIEQKKLKDYENAIIHLANNHDSLLFTNGGNQHATIVMSNIFRTAKNYVSILAGDLNGTVSNEIYLIELKKFIDRKGTKLDIKLIDNINSEPVKMILDWQKQNPEKVNIGLITDIGKVNFYQGEINHFTISDDRMYRFEYDIANYLAHVSFNDLAKVKELKRLFESIEVTPLRDLEISYQEQAVC